MKEGLRTEMRIKLKSRADDGAEAYPFMPRGTRTLFGYLAFGGELSVAAILREAAARGIAVAAPRVAGKDLEFLQIDPDSGPFATGAFGIREPLPDARRIFPSEEAIRFPLAILVPGLAFDRGGGRLGRGAGFYDRFLARLLADYADRRAEITLIGVCRSLQIVERVEREPHDIPVDCLLTENGDILCV